MNIFSFYVNISDVAIRKFIFETKFINKNIIFFKSSLIFIFIDKQFRFKMRPYKLMCSLFAHTGDVKSLCSTRDNGGFVSVSRDLSAKLWNQNE